MAHKVYLGRLPAAARQRDIERFFEGYGKIHDIVIKNGFGFCVSFAFILFFWVIKLAFICLTGV